ncbi:MAG TPA: xanthine dehydrogenase family protein molybdopterin-binding subunit [Xanthobacteraceae bacterium]|jgi:carbon-monoxide dehydrogenase large subunit
MAKFGIGQAVRRVEDQRFLLGRGRYVDDISLPGQCHGVTVLSPHAHARIKRIDVSKAAAAPGVLCVLTGADAVAEKLGSFTAYLMPEDFGAPKGHRTFQGLLTADKARFVGDRIAFVVAETLAQARDAAEQVQVEYQELPAVVDLEDAAREGAPKVWEDCAQGNVGFRLMFGNKEATDAAFAGARHVVKLRVEGNRVSPVAMEPRVAIGDYNGADDQYTLYTASQNPHGVRMEMSHIFHVAENQIRVVSPDVGGGFGLKGNPFPDDALVLWASRRVRRPVKWLATRSESMLTDHCGRETIYYGELALDEQGKILALRAQCLFQLGAYFVGAALAPGAFAVRFIPEAYDIQTMHIASQGLFTNTSQCGPYRGAGRPEAAYFTERLIERAARALDMDPAEIRRRNLIRPEKLPYATPTLWNYDSGEFERLMDQCVEASDWKGFAARKRATEKNGKLRGRAVSYYIEFGGIFNDRMDLQFNPDGTLTILGGTHSHGQGHATVFAQLVHDWLDVPLESIRYVQGDTAQVPIGRGTYGARSAVVGGNALKAAADAVIERARPMAATLLEADAVDVEFKDGQFRVVGTDKAISIIDVAKAAYAPAGPLTDKFGVGLQSTGSFSPEPPSHPNGSHVCELEVDPETGETVVDRYFVVDDLGRVLNPLIVRGQIHGGVVQGLGQALIEHQVYDRQSGQLLSGSFMDYGMPRADTMPDIEAQLEEIPCKTNPLGVKGIGESGTIGAPPTVINAIIDALRPLGVDQIDMPATPGRVWQAIANARGAPHGSEG